MPATNGSLFSIFVIVLLILTFFLLTFSLIPLLAITTYFIQHRFFLLLFLWHLEQTQQRRKTENYQISSSRFLVANDVER